MKGWIRMPKINGIMIDCSRLIEQHQYYYQLVDFMADWQMNTLLLHFSDDFGLSVQLPGFKKIAAPHAFLAKEIRHLIAHANKQGIEIIPELEVFGHTRYLTDHPDYAHLGTAKGTDQIKFNAVDPLNPATARIMAQLIAGVAEIFPSPRVHLGCDEVDLMDYCINKNLDSAKIWTDYVNTMIELAHNHKKYPLIWGDHLLSSKYIRENLRKDVVVVDWHYSDFKEPWTSLLLKAGFKEIIEAPALAHCGHRFLPVDEALNNTKHMASLMARHHTAGLINTIWCPWRYLQNAMYYGIAFSSRVVKNAGRINMRTFHADFARKVFGTNLSNDLHQFLTCWPKLNIHAYIADNLLLKYPMLNASKKLHIEKVNRTGRKVLALAANYHPSKNQQIWNAMILAAQCAWLCSEYLMIFEEGPEASPQRKNEFDNLLEHVRHKMSEEWDRTRLPGDPQKYDTKFAGHDDQYIMILMRKLKTFKTQDAVV